MNLYFFDDESVIRFALPDKTIGNFWMTNGKGENIVNISGENNTWILNGSENSRIIPEVETDKIILEPKMYYRIKKEDKEYVLYSDYVVDDSYNAFDVFDTAVISIGNSIENIICTNIKFYNDVQYVLSIEDGKWKIQNDNDSLIYINDSVLKEKVKYLKNGDVINSYGFQVILSNRMIFANNSNGFISSTKLHTKELKSDDEITDEEIPNKKMYDDADYFLRSPRMRKTIKTFNLSIDTPPAKENEQETPLIMTLAPMLTMAASSMITLSTTFQAIAKGESTWSQSAPTLVISFAMLFSMMVWPFVTKAYEAKVRKNKEKTRQDKYKLYLNGKKHEIYTAYDNQKNILEDTLVSTDVCYDSIINKRRSLWDRRMDQNDFLTVRVGTGAIPFDANIDYHSEDFQLEDDELKNMVTSFINQYALLDNVPIGYSFAENRLTAVNGIAPKYFHFFKNMLLQMMAFHSYDDLKFVVFTNKQNEKKWQFIKESPYCFLNDKSIRFFATNTEEMQELSEYLTSWHDMRKEADSKGVDEDKDYSKFKPYFLVIVDDIDLARKINIVSDLLEDKANYGFSLVVLEEKLSKIPSEVSKFITMGETVSVILNSEGDSQTRFNDEVSDKYDIESAVKTLANLPLYIDTSEKHLPNTLTFLELFGIGQIDQLNVLNRWKDNNPIKSLKAEVGVNENGDPFILDLHEKQHGPHGLVAGMTGSGKSEFIISYVLSMAVNYSPEEVAFVLIDYKGGGLAGAFVNNETGDKLPHVVGTITNLDKSEINRALSSIQSELRRRQAAFNRVRDKLGESTIDIYKYQKLYREGVINEPIPHLIIVCDEFAELKSQQPDFMDDLISTARIGRSLGVHLILATQKPSGVVDAQIWSNSKFKVCLKVQDKSDSMEMIKNELAAELKNVGRFYLQVGYNEFFAQGQAAWAGAQYYPSKEYKKPVDKNIYFIDNVGSIFKSVNNSLMKKNKSEGEELTNIVKYLISIARTTPLKIMPLWLDKISNVVLVLDLCRKYNYAKQNFIINPIIGEYDDPGNQKQGLLTLPLTEEGNTLIYGTSDSGKDDFLSTLVYSTIMTYNSDEVNLYLLDFGAETLLNYREAPQVGNVIVNGNDEELENFAKMLTNEMSKRKKAFMSYNGNYLDYIKLSGKTLPNIVVIINSIEVLNEVYQDYIDQIIPVIREGSKYGINFVITTVSQNTIRLKVAQSCKKLICLQMNSETDYRDILGKTNGIVPFACLGRGLIKLDKVVEFQTASITNEESAYNTILALVSLLKSKGFNKAKSIPVMPEIIEFAKLKDKLNGIDSVPVGINKESLTVATMNLSKNAGNIITASEMEKMRMFMLNFFKVLESSPAYNKIVIDASSFFDEFNYKINYISNDFNKVIDQLKETDSGIQDVLTKNNMNLRSLKKIPNSMVIIIGLKKFYNKLDDEHKNIFKEILDNEKEAAKLNFVFFDTPNAFKEYEYESWYKNTIDTSNGLWIGGGITQQFVLNLSSSASNIGNIENDYGVLVTSGTPNIIKLLNEIKK